MAFEDPDRAPSEPDETPAPWAPLVEEPPSTESSRPEDGTDQVEAPVPPPPPPPPLREPRPPFPVPPLRQALGKPPIGANGYPIYGPGSIPTVARRGVARGIDTLLAGVVWMIAVAAVWANVGADGKVTLDHMPFWAIAASRGVDVVYQAIAIGLTGSTLGKWIMGLKVEGPGGDRPGLHRSTLRILIPDVISFVPLFGPAIAIVIYVTGGINAPLGRTFYDQGAGTIVVSTR